MLGERLQNMKWILEVIENSQEQREAVQRTRKIERAIDIHRVNRNLRSKRFFQGPDRLHAIVIGRRIIDGVDLTSERFEEKR